MAPGSSSNLPLEGVTVLEVATLVPGPLAGMVLADLGAFKVE
jgi:crotonobetainyl-CoA:carnitine CoA-transferase CaiB-like acyl-CoA transferase